MIKRGDYIESVNGTKGKVVTVQFKNQQVEGFCVQTEEQAAPVFVYAVDVKNNEAHKLYAN